LATRLIGNLWIALGSAFVAVIVLYALRQSRPIARLLVGPRLVIVYAGVVVGVIGGTPTLLWSGRYLLRSLELFLERNPYGDTGTPFQQLVQMVGLYWNGVAPGPLQWALLVSGTLLAIRLRNMLLWPMIVGAVLGIGSQWGKLQTERHMLAWFPFFYVLMAYPVSIAWSWAMRRAGARIASVAAAAMLALFFGVYGQIPGATASENTLTHLARSGLEPRANQWLLANTTPDAKIFRVCCDTFNDQVIFDWMKQNGLSVPESVRSGTDDRVWFGDKQALMSAVQGYCVVSGAFKHYYIDYYTKLYPDRVVDPANDPHFELVAKFESQEYPSLDIYRFDFNELNDV
jgi:hypothetical protein